MRTFISTVAVSVSVAFVLLAAPARADEENVALDKVPKPVLETVKARFKGATLTGASKETEDDKVIYEVSLKDKKQNIDVTLTPAGELLMIEKEIAAKDLPKAVSKMLEGKYPKATYKMVEEVIKIENQQENLAYYELLLATADKQMLEVQITSAGKIINEEKKDPDKNEPDGQNNQKDDGQKNQKNDNQRN